MNFPAQVSYYTIDGTATSVGEEADFIAVPESDPVVLKFAANEKSKSFSITIIDDSQWEPDETFEVKLCQPYANGADGKTAVLGARDTSDVTILNDDNPGIIAPRSQSLQGSKQRRHVRELSSGLRGNSLGHKDCL